jgi:Domain of unknown function (DUF4837)
MFQSRLFLIFLISFSLSACDSVPDDKWQHDAMGEIGDVAVLTDQMTWGLRGELIDSIFSQAIPGLPGQEPYFVVRHSDESNFSGFYKKNYNLFVLIQRDRWNVLKSLFGATMQKQIEKKFRPDGLVVFKSKNVWAKPQEVHFILAPNAEVMDKSLRNKRTSFFIQTMETESRTTITSLLGKHPERDTFRIRMLEERGYAVSRPFTYQVSLRSEDCMGISRYMSAKKLGLYLYEEPYENENQFSQEYIIGRRNEVMGRHIHGTDRPDSIPTYMSTDSVNVKLFRRQFELNGLYAVETRGWWEMVNDFMAGPFVNYTILSKKQNKIISIDGNVFAPGHDKARLLRQLELIASTFEERE